MKRTPLKRKTPLRAKTPLRSAGYVPYQEYGTGLFGRAKSLRSRALKPARKPPIDAATRRRMEAFHEAIRGERCAGCGRTAGQAREETGFGHEAHHAVKRQTLRKRGLDEWPPELAVALCVEPCHRRQTSGKARVPQRGLPARVRAYAAAHGLQDALDREHPAA